MLPARVKTNLKTNAHVANQRHTASQRASISHANAILRFIAVKKADELGAAEARAVDKVLLLP